MKTIILLVSTILFSLASSAQVVTGVTHSGRSTGQAPFPIDQYEELDNPVRTDSALWTKVKSVCVSWGRSDVRYKKEIPALDKVRKNQELSVWRGERVGAQFVVWGTQSVDKLNFEVSSVRHSGSDYVVPAKNIFKGFVRYVMTDELNKDKRGTCGGRNILDFDSTLVADPIDHLTDTLMVKGCSSQGCWVRVNVPTEAPHGKYLAKVTVKDGDKVIGQLNLRLKVSERALPAVKDWAFHLDLWQNPYAVARYHRVAPWSEAHLQALRPYMELYRDAGGKVITTSLMHKPWNGQTFDYFESMVTWVKKLDGSWYFDYAVFDRWVEFMLNLGIDKQINCYSMVPWRLSFQYFDQASNSFKEMRSQPGETAYDEMWTAMLKSFAKHLKEKGWFEKTFISMDERPMPVMMKTLKVIRKADPDFKISLAGALHKELVDELDDYCVALRMKYTDEMLAKRKAEGRVTTFYTSCEEPYPNTFTFCDPADCQWFGWYAAKSHLDGYLRWALNSWVIEPLLDSRFYSFGAGDCYLIYPGGRTCLRFEQMVEGIQAYEKIRILRAEYKDDPKALQTIDESLKLIDEKTLDKVASAEAILQAKASLKKLGF